MEAEVSHFDLLFHRYGSVSFRHQGEEVSVYLAQYERDERVLHEQVGGLGVGAETFDGTILWGVTTEGDEPLELRTIVAVDGAWGQKSFDLSAIDFNFAALITTGGISAEREEIEAGRRYVLHLWQSGGMIWYDGDVFRPDRLRENEHTLILYVVFE